MNAVRRWDFPRLALTSALAAYGWFLATHPGHFGFIDNVDLAIHETGHLVFAPFGEFMRSERARHLKMASLMWWLLRP